MKNFLPEEFVFSHNFCLYLHDCLVQFIKEGEAGGFFQTHFTFQSKAEAEEFEKNPDIFIFEWLEEKGYSDTLGEGLLKSIFPALLSDFCHFVFEALSCSRKGKLTVAYALLRKPFRETLHYFEWLLADPERFLNTFYYQPSKKLAFNELSDPLIAKPVIKAAIDSTANPEMYGVDFLYDIRFNKKYPFGFDPLWNKALHLITTNQHLTTEQANFNFIFSGDEAHLTQWGHIYHYLPYLLFYALDICELLMALMNKELPSDFKEVTFHRSIGLILWDYKYRQPFEGPKEFHPDPEAFTLDCPKCNKKMLPTEKFLQKLFDKRRLWCPNCKRRIKLPHFIETA